MRPDIRKTMVNKYHLGNTYSQNTSKELPLNSTISVKINGKFTPCKTTTHRNGDLVEVTANGKKYLADWWMGEWIANKQI